MPEAPPRAADNLRLLAELSRVGNRLNTASDDLNVALQSIQDRVLGMSLGIAFWVSIDGTRQDIEDGASFDHFIQYQLGHDRFNDGWSLMTRRIRALVDTSGETEQDITEEKPLLRSPRELRLQCVRALPNLLTGLLEKAGETLSLVDEARSIAGVDDTEPRFPPPLFDLANRKVACIVSDRYLMVGPPDSMEPNGDVVTIDVMTDMVSGQTRKICQLIVPKNALMRALSQPRAPEREPEWRIDLPDDESAS